MLKNLDPRLSAEVLYALRKMGHGDYLVISDTNFPGDSVSRNTPAGKVLAMDNLSAPEATEAILSVMPLDTFAEAAVQRMEVVGAPSELPEVQKEVQLKIDEAETQSYKLEGVERFEFYERAKKAYAIIGTGERRFYGCFILTKGVIPPEES